MKINYLCTYWGCENQSAKAFLTNVIANGYDGVEINLPDDTGFINEFVSELTWIRENNNSEFIFIAQQVLDNKVETVDDYIKRLSNRLEFLVSLNPNAINSHTGKDFFDFSDNCKIIEATAQISRDSGIPIWHEIHRGRFSFHLKTLLNYLAVFPKLKLIADFSHFCTVSESLLYDQHDDLQKLYPYSVHIHARIGSSQSPQVNHPFALEWIENLYRFVGWWQEIIDVQKKRNNDFITITPEFGPFPYMPLEPFTQKPLAKQWEINLQMKNYLQQNLYTYG
jgi:hypothetical protein